MLGPVKKNVVRVSYQDVPNRFRFQCKKMANVNALIWKKFCELSEDEQLDHFVKYYRFIKNSLLLHFRTNYPKGYEIKAAELRNKINPTLEKIILECEKIEVYKKSPLITPESGSNDDLPAVRPENEDSSRKRSGVETQNEPVPNKMKKTEDGTSSFTCQTSIKLDAASTSKGTEEVVANVGESSRQEKEETSVIIKQILRMKETFPGNPASYIEKIESVISHIENGLIKSKFRLNAFKDIATALGFDDEAKTFLFHLVDEEL